MPDQPIQPARGTLDDWIETARSLLNALKEPPKEPPDTETKLKSVSLSPRCGFGFATNGDSLTNFSSGPFPNEVGRTCGFALGLGFDKFRRGVLLPHMTSELELTYLKGHPDDEFTSDKLDVPLIRWKTVRKSDSHFLSLQGHWALKEPLFEWKNFHAVTLKMGVGLAIVHFDTTITSDSRSEPEEVSETMLMGLGSVGLEIMEWEVSDHLAVSLESGISLLIGSDVGFDRGGFGFSWEFGPKVRSRF